MDSKKFDQMVREFPFIKQVIAGLPSFTGDVNDVIVKRGDRNLLEVKPGGWHHDAGSWGDHSGYRHFWCVAAGKLIKLKSGQHTTRVPHGTRVSEMADQIGAQLIALNLDVQYVVEASDEGWDWEDPNPTITIYKMQGFEWRKPSEPKELTDAKAFVDESFFSAFIDELVEKRKRLLASLITMQSIIAVSFRNNTARVGLYVKHDDKSITISKDGKQVQIGVSDIRGIEKL